MEIAALTYTIGICAGAKSAVFKPLRVFNHEVRNNRLVLTCDDGAVMSLDLDKLDYKLYPDYKAAKEVKSKLMAQLKTELTKPIEETPQDASRI